MKRAPDSGDRPRASRNESEFPHTQRKERTQHARRKQHPFTVCNLFTEAGNRTRDRDSTHAGAQPERILCARDSKPQRVDI